ncbi:hypothetical protein [Escherichia coli]|uniref:Uncharacterized protein n=1 Tax=Escherichia coli TA447 TaxID=656447 RepID=A0A1X3ITQ4_ECOLX|nr:hypothetical protein [Escherichia coli]OSK88079.1 hypothetical protein ECXG_04278 [Escherichia coli TA447]
MKYIILLSISFLMSFKTYATQYYSILRGNQQIVFKSTFPGILNLNNNQEGQIYSAGLLFNVESYEYTSKLSTLKKRLQYEKNKKLKSQLQLKIAKEEFEKGFIPLNELDEIKEKTTDISLKIYEIESEIYHLKQLLPMNSPRIDAKYIIRNIYSADGVYVKSGEDILKIETLDAYHLDIKFDPSSLTGNIKNKEIRVRSLTGGFSGKAVVTKIFNPDNNNGIYGLKIASLRVETDSQELSDYLDTTFEVIIND